MFFAVRLQSPDIWPQCPDFFGAVLFKQSAHDCPNLIQPGSGSPGKRIQTLTRKVCRSRFDSTAFRETNRGLEIRIQPKKSLSRSNPRFQKLRFSGAYAVFQRPTYFPENPFTVNIGAKRKKVSPREKIFLIFLSLPRTGRFRRPPPFPERLVCVKFLLTERLRRPCPPFGGGWPDRAGGGVSPLCHCVTSPPVPGGRQGRLTRRDCLLTGRPERAIIRTDVL